MFTCPVKTRGQRRTESLLGQRKCSLSQPFPIKFPLLWAMYFHSRWARPSIQGVMNSSNLNILISQCPPEPKMSLDY